MTMITDGKHIGDLDITAATVLDHQNLYCIGKHVAQGSSSFMPKCDYLSSIIWGFIIMFFPRLDVRVSIQQSLLGWLTHLWQATRLTWWSKLTSVFGQYGLESALWCHTHKPHWRIDPLVHWWVGALQTGLHMCHRELKMYWSYQHLATYQYVAHAIYLVYRAPKAGITEHWG